jgi:hypothetical protein
MKRRARAAYQRAAATIPTEIGNPQRARILCGDFSLERSPRVNLDGIGKRVNTIFKNKIVYY